ncbi:MAG: tagaturonate reductase [Mediterranea sp.]|jgi:tagaturonate reductase|nr:tagaturonate reductase [Mediterranea sp.]
MKDLNRKTVQAKIYPERIIQFGEGNFLRAFADWIIYNMNEKANFNSSVVVVQPIDKGMADLLNAQDNLYHVNLQGLDKGQVVNDLTLIDVISRSLNPYSQNGEFLKLADRPEMRFVISNTTEAGIAFDPSCKLEDTPASSYPGKLTQLLYRRFRTFNGDKSKGLIIFPCELIFLNGHRLKETICQYIELWGLGDGFKAWFEEACAVYATLVDRIVPGFPRKDIDAIKEKLQYNDNLVVQAEIFHLWVIEAPQEVANEFPADKAGLNVLFVPSEAPYHERKVCLLNGPHTVLSPVAYLSGINIVRDACEHPVVGKYIRKVMYDELMETLNLPKDELTQFADDVWERFSNPFVDHAVTSIMLNSFPKFETRDLPGLKTYLERKGELPEGLVLGLAAIITYYKGGVRADGAEIVPNDAPGIMNLLKDLWATGDTEKIAKGVLAAESIWGEDLNHIPGLTAAIKADLDSIQEKGMLETVKGIIPTMAV